MAAANSALVTSMSMGMTEPMVSQRMVRPSEAAMDDSSSRGPMAVSWELNALKIRGIKKPSFVRSIPHIIPPGNGYFREVGKSCG